MSFADEIRLKNGAQEASVLPTLGGRVRSYRTMLDDKPIDWLQPIPDDVPVEQAVRLGGCYPLVPYCNRICVGHFFWRGRDVQLAASPIAAPHSLHGVGWRRPWEVTERDDASVTLQLIHQPDADWPWYFTARQTIRLEPDGLWLSLSMTNTDQETQPVGLGFHPFFPLSDTSSLQFSAARYWPVRGNQCRAERASIPTPLDFSIAKAPMTGIDDCFGGFAGTAQIFRAGDQVLEIAASPHLGHIHLFIPAGRPFFCLEPVSHAPNVVNMADAEARCGGFRELAAAESFAVSLGFRLLKR